MTECGQTRSADGEWSTNWAARREVVPGGLRVALFVDGVPAVCDDVLTGLASVAAFRAWFNDLLAGMPYPAFRWETPGVTVATLVRPFEFVALAAPELEREPDRMAFATHFARAPQRGAIAFPNLGGDATLIVPPPRADDSAYGHLGAFVRSAPEAQRDELWKLVAETMLRRVSSAPVWLSTAGAGVSWLHVRLDDRPKYYGHRPYRRM